MDLLFTRYANPFLFINSLIKSNSLNKGLLSLIEFKNDDLTWQMYCSMLANPMNNATSYKEFKKKLYGNQSKTSSEKQELKNEEIKRISKESNDILAKFKPQ